MATFYQDYVNSGYLFGLFGFKTTLIRIFVWFVRFQDYVNSGYSFGLFGFKTTLTRIFARLIRLQNYVNSEYPLGLFGSFYPSRVNSRKKSGVVSKS